MVILTCYQRLSSGPFDVLLTHALARNTFPWRGVGAASPPPHRRQLCQSKAWPSNEAQLVQEEIYTVTRKPIYLGLMLGSLGWALLRKSIPSLALVGLLVLFLDRKASREEVWLTHKFPEFEQYRQRVRRGWARTVVSKQSPVVLRHNKAHIGVDLRPSAVTSQPATTQSRAPAHRSHSQSPSRDRASRGGRPRSRGCGWRRGCASGSRSSGPAPGPSDR
jgi:hypothetical protein